MDNGGQWASLLWGWDGMQCRVIECNPLKMQCNAEFNIKCNPVKKCAFSSSSQCKGMQQNAVMKSAVAGGSSSRVGPLFFIVPPYVT